MPEDQQRNVILARLEPADFKLIEPHLEPVELPLRKVLEQRHRRITAIYFPESGFASVVANGERPIEVGIVGREGMTGLPVVLGGDRNANETFIQVAGQGQTMRAKALREAIKASVTLHLTLLRYVQSFLDQTTQTAVSNGRSRIDERLARWLLMAADRLDDEEMPLTHEFLAMMLSIRRQGVSEAVHALERDSIIERRRGRIFITDRRALEKRANGTYVNVDPR